MRKTVARVLAALVTGLLVGCGSVLAQAQTNLIKNPSFETIDDKRLPADWHLRGIALEGKSGQPRLRIGPPACDGQNAARLSFGTALDSAYLDQCYWKLLATGQKYSFSARLRANKPARVSMALCAIGEEPRKGEKILELQRRQWNDVTPEWQRYSTVVTIDGAGQYVLLRCIVQLHTAGVTLSIDDVALVHENPQPAEKTALHPTHSVGCVRTKTAPVIDGKLRDACWKRAGITQDFTNVASSANLEPTQQTKVYLLYDEENLYVAYRCYESDIDSIRAENTKRDAPGLWSDDCVELFLDPPDTSFPGIAVVGPKYYYLLATSRGTQGDNVGSSKMDQWDGKWLARTAREKDAWTVEIRIPLRELDARPSEGTLWKVNFTRSQKRLGENSSWSPVEAAFHDPTRFADMYFVKDHSSAALVVAAAVARQSENITTKWCQTLLRTEAEIEKLLGPLRTSSLNQAKDFLPRLTQAQKEIKDISRDLGDMKPREVLEQEESLNDTIEAVLGSANVFANAANALLYAEQETSFIVRSAPTITNNRILPRSLVSAEAPQELSLSACPEEYEPLSFVVTPSYDIEALTVTCSNLTSGNGVIPSTAIDIKLVKCWYQAGDGWAPQRVQSVQGKVLMPELLVNDDNLVRVDLENTRNLLRVADPNTGRQRYQDVTVKNNDTLTRELVVRDATSLLPVDIPAGQVRQFWVTVHVPAAASAGTYAGKITVRCKGSSAVVLPVRLAVHPFKLAPSVVEQSIFYRGQLSGSDVPLIDTNKKTEAQYLAEIRNMVSHGLDAPLCYQTPGDGRPDAMALMRRALEIRKQAGVSIDRFFGCFWGYGPEGDPELTRRVLGEVIELTKSFGYREYYNYGPDEASVEQARQQIEPWRFLREEIGAKVYLAASPDVWEGKGPVRRELWNHVKEVVNLFISGGAPNPEWAARLHEAGLLIYNYANPQCGIEEPLTYRRNYGLLLWKAGYDGAMDYAYQHGFGGHMWNDFDAANSAPHNYRDHVMAYVTSDGVVDTLQWEGYREGVDDLRYLSTLLQEIGRAKNDPARAEQARKIEKWVATIDPNGDLDKLRGQIVIRIVGLSGGKETQR